MRDEVLPQDAASEAQLESQLASLTLPLPCGVATSTAAAKLTSKQFRLEPNKLGAESVSFRFDNDSCLFTLKEGKAEFTVRCGIGNWSDGVTDMPGTPPEMTEVIGSKMGAGQQVKIAAAGAWKDDRTFGMHWRYYETPHHDRVTCHFDEDQVRIEFMNSITQPSPVYPAVSPRHPETRPVLQGSVAL
jgi:hypothetical protein